MPTSPEPTQPVPGFVCTRWRRFGHDRLYVAAEGAPEGQQLGYRDLLTGTDHPTDVTHAAQLTSVVEAWTDAHASPAPTPDAPAAPSHEPPPAPAAPWVDLSQNRAG